VSTQLFTGSCHTWFDFVGQDKIAEPGVRSQSNYTRLQYILMAILLNPSTVLSTLPVTKIRRQQSSRHEVQDYPGSIIHVLLDPDMAWQDPSAEYQDLSVPGPVMLVFTVRQHSSLC